MPESMKTLLARARAAIEAMVLWVARKWLWIVMSILAAYISLPWLAPTLAWAGLSAPADLIYTLYSPFCHQFAFRSPFLYGEQAFYPRAAAGMDYQPFEVYAVESEVFLEQYQYWTQRFGGPAPQTPLTVDDLRNFSVAQQLAARHFVGDESFGYKTSLCARDLATFSMIFIGGLIYWRFRWRIRPLPLLLYLFVGLGPIAIDGFSQLLSYPPFELWPARETTPYFRLVTGGLFGLMSAWLGFPHIERSMQDIVERLVARRSDNDRST